MHPRLLLSTALAGLIALSAPMAAQAADSTQKGGAATGASLAQGETVDERIANLHDKLQITPDEEKKWGRVAEAMRGNDAEMKKKMQDKMARAADGMTAKEDLQTYEEFAQAHVDGLKSLRSAFDALYDAMPADQRKIADQVFQNAKKQ